MTHCVPLKLMSRPILNTLMIEKLKFRRTLNVITVLAAAMGVGGGYHCIQSRAQLNDFLVPTQPVDELLRDTFCTKATGVDRKWAG